MTVVVDLTRKAVNLSWLDEDGNPTVDGDATITTHNPDTGDTSSHEAGSDGYGVVTFPSDYSGTCEVTVTGADGGEDSGTIAV